MAERLVGQVLQLQRRALMRVYFEVLALTRVDARALQRHAGAGRALVLNLHDVSPHITPYAPAMHPNVFDELLGWLSRHATVALLADLKEGTSAPGRPLVVLSFDDGYRGFVEYAMPIMERHGVRANQNVIGATVSSGVAPWHVRFLDFMGSAPPSVLRALPIPGIERWPASEDPLAKERFAALVGNRIKSLPPLERRPLVDAVEEAMQDLECSRPTLMMSAPEVAEAAAAGHEIGAHSYSHESMALVSDDEFLADLARCQAVLDDLGLRSRIYAFPNGSYRPGQVRLLQDAGFEHVLLTGEAPSRPTAHVHPRITLRGHCTAECRVRASGLAPRRRGGLLRLL